MRDAFIANMYNLADADPNVVLLTADLGFGVFDEFVRRHPRQFLNVGVAEQNMISVAAGLALTGHRPFAYSIGNFPSLRCLEQVRNDVCYPDLAVTIVSVGAGFSYGQLGYSHHATEDISVMRALPRMTVLSPGDDEEAAWATQAAAAIRSPCYLRLDRASNIGFSKDGLERPQLGRPRLIRDGVDVGIVATGGITSEASRCADALEARGISVRLVHMHTLKPIDEVALQQLLLDMPLVVTIEEHSLYGGLSAAVMEALAGAYRALPRFMRVGLGNEFVKDVGDQAYLRSASRLSSDQLAEDVAKML